MNQVPTFDFDSRELLTLHGQVWETYVGRDRHVLMDEAHKLRFPIHSGVTNMYHDM